MALESLRYRRRLAGAAETSGCCRGSSATSGWGRGARLAAIRDMEVRGAPAIALLGCLSLAVELAGGAGPREDLGALEEFVGQRLGSCSAPGPTAANLGREAQRLRAWLRKKVGDPRGDPPGAAGEHHRVHRGAAGQGPARQSQHRRPRGPAHPGGGPGGGPVTILTHCNTGTLATAGYGTAPGGGAGPARAGSLSRVFCTETRPFHQGSRLSALELRHDGIPVTIIADSAAAAAMRERGVHAVVVGADRVAANGDVANKIGTFQLALAARHLRVPFYVAAPSSSCDPALPSGRLIPIEERPGTELTQLGGVLLAEPEVDVWNPAFDVTPHDLITGGIITEWGVFPPSQLCRELEQREER
ncbi:unnamed protein product [Coccothraustes coccothraustes]